MQFLPFLGLLAAFLLADIRRAPWWMVVVAIAGAASGLYALRGVGIGAIMIMPAVLIANAGPSLAAAPRTSQVARRAMEWTAAAAIVAVVMTAAVARGPVETDPRRLPVQGTEALAERIPDARVLTRYEWGGYLIDRLYDDGARVFVDGRMHKYAPDVLEDYLAIIDATPRWRALIDEYGVEAILVSPDTPLAKGPAQEDGWCEAYRDRHQVSCCANVPRGDAQRTTLKTRTSSPSNAGTAGRKLGCSPWLSVPAAPSHRLSGSVSPGPGRRTMTHSTP